MSGSGVGETPHAAFAEEVDPVFICFVLLHHARASQNLQGGAEHSRVNTKC